jgi:tripartite-type tricarboxylate transporter receptor subunit TctC
MLAGQYDARLAPPSAVSAALTDLGIQTRFAQLGTVPVSMTPAEFGKLIGAESEKWGKVFRSAGIKGAR